MSDALARSSGSNNGRQDRKIPLPNDVSLLPDEKLIKNAVFHWGIYWKGCVVGVFGLLLTLKVFNLGVFILFVASLMLGLAYMTKHFMLLVLTNKRLLIRSGLIRMDTVQLSLERVESVELERTIPGMLLGYASVVITGTGSRVMAVPFVDLPHVFRRLTEERVYAEHHKDKTGN
jgi:uncharacterized membrane protein YdbT with pleckstrin-like domain